MNEYTAFTKSSLETPSHVDVVHAYRVDRGWDTGWEGLGMDLSSERYGFGVRLGRKVEEEKIAVKNKWERKAHSRYTRRLPALGGGVVRTRVFTLIAGAFGVYGRISLSSSDT